MYYDYYEIAFKIINTVYVTEGKHTNKKFSFFLLLFFFLNEAEIKHGVDHLLYYKSFR